MYLGTDVSTYDMTISSETTLNYYIPYLQSKTHPIMKNLSRHPINQSHPTHHSIIQRSTPRNLASSTTGSSQVLQQYNKTRLTQPFPSCFKDKPYFLTNTPLNSQNFFHALPILALTASDARP